jgi:hypothetical protein
MLATREFDHEPVCDSCAIDRLIETVERLSTAYVSVTAEVRYDHD